MTVIDAEVVNNSNSVEEKSVPAAVRNMASGHKLTRYSESVLSDDSYPFSNDEGAGGDSSAVSSPLTPQTCHNTASLADCDVDSIAQLLHIRSKTGSAHILVSDEIYKTGFIKFL